MDAPLFLPLFVALTIGLFFLLVTVSLCCDKDTPEKENEDDDRDGSTPLFQ